MKRFIWTAIALVLIASAWQGHAATPGAAFILAMMVLWISAVAKRKGHRRRYS
jgi:hypothetical protein